MIISDEILETSTLSVISSKARSNNKNISNRIEDRNLRFSNFITVHEIIHINDLSYDEIKHSWYSQHEYKKIKENISAIVGAIQSGTYEGDTNDDCLRGIECRLKKNALRRKKTKMFAMMVVLGEQEEQDLTSNSDAKGIAQAYMSVTKQSAASAHKMALLDQAEANESLHIETNPNKKRKDKTIRQIIASRLLGRKKHRENVN
jgi:hypothetical protein